MSAPISKDIQWQHTASKVFIRMHTCSVSPSCLTLHSGSCVPLGMSLVIHPFKALWFMSAFKGREKGAHCCGFTACFFWTNGDGSLTGAHVRAVKQSADSVSENRKALYILVYEIWHTQSCLILFYKSSAYHFLCRAVAMNRSRLCDHYLEISCSLCYTTWPFRVCGSLALRLMIWVCASLISVLLSSLSLCSSV